MSGTDKNAVPAPYSRESERDAIVTGLRRAYEEGGASGIADGIQGLAQEAMAGVEHAADALIEAIRRIAS